MPSLSIMLKPASSACNLRCKYCFYHDVSEKREHFSYGMMSESTARNVIEKAFKFAGGEPVYFVFQGGEPTLRGLEFFRDFVSVAHKLNNKSSPVYYALQTNGTLIDEQWAEFFKVNNFLIGLSLDGDRSDNLYRVDASGRNTFKQVMDALQLFKRYGVEFNILTVVTAHTGKHIEAIYAWFKSQGFRNLQFIPCLRPFGDDIESELYLTVEQYGEYLVKLFTMYVKDYEVGNYISIRQLDNMVSLYLGGRAEQCGASGHCSPQFVVEGDGSVFPCDFYCVDEWKLGNINSISFGDMARSDRIIEFIRESYVIKAECRECEYFGLCRGGGCKRNRVDMDYCMAYKKFFDTCLPLFETFYNENTRQ